jgi:hypothetical protein
MSRYPYGIAESLSDDHLDQLEATMVPLGYGRTRSVADLVVGWAAHVNKLHAESDLRPGEDRDSWNAHDYVAALIIRGFVERGLDLLGDELRSAASQLVGRFDGLFGSFTEADEQHLVRRFAGEDAGPQWWWQRIPRSGPVRAELLGVTGANDPA